MKAICGYNCDECTLRKKNGCEGCLKTKGCPFGKKCFIAKYIEVGGKESFEVLKKELMNEINALKIAGMPKIKELYALHGSFINLEYPLPNKKKVKFLDDNEIYLGNQVECLFSDDNPKCFGIVANMGFILVCEYGENSSHPEIIVYKRR